MIFIICGFGMLSVAAKVRGCGYSAKWKAALGMCQRPFSLCLLALLCGEANAQLRYSFDRDAALSRSGNVRPTVPALRCAAPVAPMMDMSRLFGFYQPDRTRSNIDKDAMGRYMKRVWPTKAMTDRLGKLRDMYLFQEAPRDQIASCILRNLQAWAAAGAFLQGLDDNDLMGHRQAVLIIIWQAYSMANAYALVAPESGLSRESLAEVRSWFASLADTIVAEFTPPAAPREAKWKWLDATANHSHWAALSIGSIAVLTEDRAKFSFAMTELHKALAQVGAEGALPYEVQRGGRSLQYQNFAMAAIAGLVALADANGVVLSVEEEAAVQRAARFTVEQNFDPSRLEAMTGRKQEQSTQALGWVDILLPHLRRTSPSLAREFDSRVLPLRPFVDKFLGGETTRLFNPEATLPGVKQ